MPGIVLTVSGEANGVSSQRLAEEITRLTCSVLRKEPERTMVILRHVPHDQWFIGSRSLADYGKNSFRLEVTITDETNTKAEKAAYHQAAFTLLSDLIGNLHPHSNIHVMDCRAAAYGYGGVTQERFSYCGDAEQ
jgi:4-oxalocrotonate tautomerase